MLFLAEPLTRFAKKHPKLVCKPGLRGKKVGQAEMPQKELNLHSFFYFHSLCFGVDVRTWLRIQKTQGILPWDEKKRTLLACRQRRRNLLPNVYEHPIHPRLYIWCISPAKRTPGTPLALYSDYIRRWEDIKSPLCHATFDWNGQFGKGTATCMKIQ